MAKSKSNSTALILAGLEAAKKEMFTWPNAALIAAPGVFVGLGYSLELVGHLMTVKHPVLGPKLVEAGQMVTKTSEAVLAYNGIDIGKSTTTKFKEKSKTKESKYTKNKNHKRRTPPVVINQVVIQQTAPAHQTAPVIEQAVINPQITLPATTQPVVEKPITVESLGWGHKAHVETLARRKTRSASNNSSRHAARKTNG